MSIRHFIELALQVGQDITLDEKMFDGAISATLDSLDHCEAGTYTLDAGDTNVQVDFGDVAEARIIWIEADGDFEVSLGGVVGTVGTLLGSGGTFPTSFAGGETFGFLIDGIAVAGAFLIGDQSAAQCAARMNAAAMLAGCVHVPFVTEGGQIRVSGALATSAGEVEVTVARATIGFAALTSDAGTSPSGAYAPQQIRRPLDADSSTAATAKAYYVATVKTTSLFLTNLETATAVLARVCILGDLTEG